MKLTVVMVRLGTQCKHFLEFPVLLCYIKHTNYIVNLYKMYVCVLIINQDAHVHFI